MKKNDSKFPKLNTKDILLTLFILILCFSFGFFGGYSCSSCNGVITANADSPPVGGDFSLACGGNDLIYTVSVDDIDFYIYNQNSSLSFFDHSLKGLVSFGSSYFAPSVSSVGLTKFEFPSVVLASSSSSKTWLDDPQSRVIRYSTALYGGDSVSFRPSTSISLFNKYFGGDFINIESVNLYDFFNNFTSGYYVPQGSSSPTEYFSRYYLLTDNFNINQTVCIYYGIPLDISLVYQPLVSSPLATSVNSDFYLAFTYRFYYSDTSKSIDFGNISYFDSVYIPFINHSFSGVSFPSFNLSRLTEYIDIADSYGSGYSNGYTSGYSTGYTSGYNKGLDTALSDVTPLSWVSSSVNSLLKTEIIPSVSFSLLISVGFGILMLGFILKWFLGG